jgi:hypothetical protein
VAIRKALRTELFDALRSAQARSAHLEVQTLIFYPRPPSKGDEDKPQSGKSNILNLLICAEGELQLNNSALTALHDYSPVGPGSASSRSINFTTEFP